MRYTLPAPAEAHFPFTSTLRPPRRRQPDEYHASTHEHDRYLPNSNIRPRDHDADRSRATYKPSHRSRSPHIRAPQATNARGARDAGRDKPADADRTPAPIARHRDAVPRRHSPPRRPRSPERTLHSPPNYRHRSPDRSTRTDWRPADSPPRIRRPDPRDRFRHEPLLSNQPVDAAPHLLRSRASIEKFERPISRFRSPLGRPRSRSRSPLPRASQLGRPRFESSLRRPGREPHIARSPPRLTHAQLSSHEGDRPPTRREELRLDEFSTSVPPLSPAKLDLGLARNPYLASIGRTSSSQLAAGHSSEFVHRRPPTPTQRLPRSPLHSGQESVQDRPGRDRRTPDLGGAGYNHSEIAPQAPPPRRRIYSPHQARDRPASHTPNARDHTRHRAVPPIFATAANSVEVNMSARGNFRGAYGGQYSRGHYNQGPNDQRNFAHSTSGSSFQGSPSTQSYPSGRGNWAGQQQASPQR